VHYSFRYDISNTLADNVKVRHDEGLPVDYSVGQVNLTDNLT
jgi:hypothetical protein